jgi:hypothetical protein
MQTSGFDGELLLEGEEAHTYTIGNLLGSVKYIGA